MPKASLARQQFNSKKPFLLVAAYAAVLAVFAVGWFFSKVASVRREALEKVSAQVEPLDGKKTQLVAAEDKLKKSADEAGQFGRWLQDRTYWADIIANLNQVLKESEVTAKTKMGVPVGIWIDTLLSTEPSTAVVAQAEEDSGSTVRNAYAMDPILAKRYGLIPSKPAGAEGEGGEGEGAKPKSKGPANSTNEIIVLNLTIRAKNLNPKANSEIAYEVERAMQSGALFDSKDTQLSGDLEPVTDNAASFSFPLKVKLKRPIKL